MSLDPFWKLSIPSYSSDITKQLSTFHLPLWGEMRMYSLKSWYNGPYLFLTDASHDISHVHLYLVTHFPLHRVYICQTTSLPYYFYSNITNVNATYSHQRPPSVGMPRHAFRRRIPSIRVSAVAARWSGCVSQPSLPRGEGPVQRPRSLFFYIKKNDTPESDFETHP